MSRYGDTAMGMVESAMEFLRISRDENYHNIVLSMKSSNPLVMVQAYRLLVKIMREEFGVIYPLHLGVTEAGDGEDGRIKSAIGIGTLLEDGIGDTIRVSLTEDPEFEIPVCKDLVRRYENKDFNYSSLNNTGKLPYSPFEYLRRITSNVSNIGGSHVPVVIADYMKEKKITQNDLQSIGYRYDPALDKWNISDGAADYIYTADKILDYSLPGTLQVICNYKTWLQAPDKQKYHPLLQAEEIIKTDISVIHACYIGLDINDKKIAEKVLNIAGDKNNIILCLWSTGERPMLSVRNFISDMMARGIKSPVIIVVESSDASIDEQLIHFSAEAGALLLDGMGDGLWLMNDPSLIVNQKISGRTYLETKNNHQFINNTSFSILQATRTRISKTEYISCPSCGRTLFDLQETTAKIRSVTNHLKGVKIAIMGCIVNGPGEMADADFGYVGSGPGKITLYKGKEVVKRSVNSDVAVDELINLLKESEVWIEP